MHMMKFARFLFLCTATFFSAFAARADVYLVTDQIVEVTAETAAEARAEAFQRATISATYELLNRITSYRDRAEAGVVINAQIANRLRAAVDVQEENQSSTLYRGNLSVKFNPTAVAAFLDIYNVPFVDSQDAVALVLPHAGKGVDPVAWVNVWSGFSTDNTLAPLRGGITKYPSMTEWDMVSQDVVQAGARRGVLASAVVSANGSYFVRLRDLRAGQTEPRIIGTVGPISTLEEAPAAVVDYLENEWLERTIVRAEGETQVSAIALFSSRAGWIEIDRALHNSRLVRDIQIQSVSTRGADLTFSFIGRPDQLTTDLQAAGVQFSADSNGWILQSALGR